MPKIIGGSLHEHREQTRQKLFAALSALMADQGFDAITLAEIASAAGVGRTAVYNHFPDKESLLLGFITHETEQYAATLQRALDDIDDPTEQLQTYVRQQAALTRVYHLAPGPELRSVLSRGTQQRVREHVVVVEQILRRILAAGIESGAFPEQDLDVTVPLINACLSGRGVPADGPERERAIAADRGVRAARRRAPLFLRPPSAGLTRWRTAHAAAHRPPTTAATPSARRPARPGHPPGGPRSLELTFLPGLGDVLADEAVEVLMLDGAPTPVPGRDDALEVALLGPLAAVLDLRTAVAAFVVLRFDVPRPKSLTSGDHLQRIVDAMDSSLRVGQLVVVPVRGRRAATRRCSRGSRRCSPRPPACGTTSAQGELVLRVRRGRACRAVRRPRLGRPGPRRPATAVRAPVAGHRLPRRRERDDRRGDGPPRRRRRRTDRVLNLMCGSGTLLVERLLAGPAADAVGVDLSADAAHRLVGEPRRRPRSTPGSCGPTAPAPR